jgi:hypothetical protein
MQSLADRLPPEIASQIHPDWQRNEAAYWAARDKLLQQYRDQWIAFADGAIIVSGRNPTDVFHDGQATGRHPFFTCVGREDEPDRIRKTLFSYDKAYPGEALPVLTVEFRTDPVQPGLALDRVIPDTGADASVLPWADCQRLQLILSQGALRSMGGVGQSSTPTMSFSVWVLLDGNTHRCRLNADFRGNERILGRDVLNRIDVLFRGPAGEVVVNP